MIARLLITIFSIFILPQFEVQHPSADRKELSVKFDVSLDKELKERIGRGLEVRYRFFFKLCKKRALWFDRCFDENIEVHLIKFDPVSQEYRVTSDRLGDEFEPVTGTYLTLDEAISALSKIEKISVASLVPESQVETSISSNRTYLGLRVVAYSKEEDRETIDWLSYLITLGLLDIDEYDSGWVNFYLYKLT